MSFHVLSIFLSAIQLLLLLWESIQKSIEKSLLHIMGLSVIISPLLTFVTLNPSLVMDGGGLACSEVMEGLKRGVPGGWRLRSVVWESVMNVTLRLSEHEGGAKGGLRGLKAIFA